jgi:hypothetical protein
MPCTTNIDGNCQFKASLALLLENNPSKHGQPITQLVLKFPILVPYINYRVVDTQC